LFTIVAKFVTMLLCAKGFYIGRLRDCCQCKKYL